MPHVLHLIKDPANQTALDVVAQQAHDPGLTLSVVLLQKAARLAAPLPGQVFRLDDGEAGHGESPYPAINHAGLLDLIFAADTVVTW
ncbi:MAG TPA: hypothetical protein VGW35_17740 [Methylomirabilota bacterium]|jgi:hypothetical protein|nr:hypothetical protein [Methylomirabilota bacterium]